MRNYFSYCDYISRPDRLVKFVSAVSSSVEVTLKFCDLRGLQRPRPRSAGHFVEAVTYSSYSVDSCQPFVKSHRIHRRYQNSTIDGSRPPPAYISVICVRLSWPSYQLRFRPILVRFCDI